MDSPTRFGDSFTTLSHGAESSRVIQTSDRIKQDDQFDERNNISYTLTGGKNKKRTTGGRGPGDSEYGQNA